MAVLLALALPSAASAAPPSNGLEWSKNAVIYEVNVRQYTEEGTFKAFEEHLPRLKELGVDILWFMPIHPVGEENRKGTLGSYYSVRDYQAVNPEFGTVEDFKALVAKAHGMGFKVMLDFVPNHTAHDHLWTEQHPDWYVRDEEGNLTPPVGTDWTDVAQLNWNNPDMRAGLIDAMRFWVREADVDGYRMDYVTGVPDDFWPDVRAALDEIKPTYLLAENEDKTHLLENEFQANYGWTMFHTMHQIAQGKQKARDLQRYVEWVQKTYPDGAYPMQFTSNHDENSWNGTTRELFGDAEKTMAALTFLAPGMPLIYSGQEAGLDKRLEFFEKDQIPWDDLSMQDFYEGLVTLKKDNPALWNGAAGGRADFLKSSDENVLSFAREKDGSRVVVVANLSAEPTTATVDAGDYEGEYQDHPAGSSVELERKHTFELRPWEYKILIQ